MEYETSSTSTALQWLKPEQTAGKQQPYLFTQCQVCMVYCVVMDNVEVCSDGTVSFLKKIRHFCKNFI